MPRSSALPSWAGKVIYLALIDRFADGDKTRNDFGRDEHSPTDDEKFQGGDLEGLRRRLPYLKRLGVDAVWITPPVHNQWINPGIATRGYHGYWTYDFTAVDPHFGTLEDYRRMVDDAHKLGLKIIQDIVVNHTGNYFTVTGEGYESKHPERNWRALPEAYPPEGEPKAPNDPVFKMNDPRDPAHKAAGVYHFTPNISDYLDRRQTLTYTMGDLDDINLKNPLAARRMREIYRFWIEKAGVDGFRVDTVYYTPESFYDGFLRRADPRDPGVKRFAAARGQKEFFVFGEVWSYDYKTIGRYLSGPCGPRLDSAVDLPLNEALCQVFFRKAATERLRAPLAAARRNPELWVTFIDNHDIERAAAQGAPRAVRQSLAALFTLPGLPCVYYGTEAGLTNVRQNMFDDAHCDESREEHLFVKRLIALRKSHPALSTGRARLVDAGPNCGVLAYTVVSDRRRYRALFNTSPAPAVCALPGGGRGVKVLLSSKTAPKLGPVMTMPAESFLLLDESAAPRRAAAAPAPRLSPPGRKPLNKPFDLRFSAPPALKAARLELLCDGDLERRLPVPDPRSGRLLADPELLGDGRRQLRLLATLPGGRRSLSNPVEVELRCAARLLAESAVPASGKGGFGGRRILPPQEKSYDGQLSLEHARVYARGRDLALELKMGRVTNSWNPPHGYDHVYFGVFVQKPGDGAAAELPLMNARVPGFRWDAGFLLHGWAQRSFAADTASVDAYGPPLPGEVKQSADLASATVNFSFSERCFGSLVSWKGARVLVTTWDGYLGQLREVAAAPGDWCFAAADGNPLDAPKIYDHVLLNL